MGNLTNNIKDDYNVKYIIEGDNIYYLVPNSRKGKLWWSPYVPNENDNISLSTQGNTTIITSHTEYPNGVSYVGPTGKTETQLFSEDNCFLSVKATIEPSKSKPSQGNFAYDIVQNITGYGQDYSKDTRARRQYIVYNKTPETIDKNTCICICEGGAGGVYGDIATPIIKNPNVQNSNVAIINVQSSSLEDLEGTSLVADRLASDTGANRTNRVYMGHSMTGPEMAKVATDYLRNEHAHGRETKTTLVLNDCKNDSIFKETEGLGAAEEFDGSLVIASVQSKYLRQNKETGEYTVKNGTRLDYYDEGLKACAENNADVLVVSAYAVVDEHVSSNEVTANLGLCDPHTAILTDSVVTNGNTRSVQYFHYDKEGNLVPFSDAKEAQAFLDASVGRMDLFNAGFLHQNGDNYILNAGGRVQEATREEIDSFVLECRRAYDETGHGDQTFDEFMDKYAQTHSIGASNNNDSVPPNSEDVGKACAALLDSLGDIKNHMDSLLDIPGLDKKQSVSDIHHGKAQKDFLDGMNSFPNGVSTAGLEARKDCVNSLGSNLEDAYNATANLYEVMTNSEGSMLTYYPHNNFSNAGRVEDKVDNFAEDI